MTRIASYSLAVVLGLLLAGMLALLSSHAVTNLFAGAGSVLGSLVWNYRHAFFGAFSLFYGTLVVAAVALAIAVPIGVAAAVFLSEYLTGKTRASAKIAIELLAGVPSIVMGLLGVIYLRAWLAPLHSWIGVNAPDSLFTGGILLSLMLLPTITSLSDDALRCVSRAHREAAYGLGLTRPQTIFKVLLPQARAGIFGATLLAIGRALGETVAVFLVVGRSDRVFQSSQLGLKSLFEAGQTITSKLGGSEIAIAYGDASHWSALMALALVLWSSVAVSAYGSSFLLARQRSVRE